MFRARRVVALAGMAVAATAGLALPASALTVTVPPVVPVVQQVVTNVTPNGSYWCWDRYWYQWVPCYLAGYGIGALPA